MKLARQIFRNRGLSDRPRQTCCRFWMLLALHLINVELIQFKRRRFVNSDSSRRRELDCARRYTYEDVSLSDRVKWGLKLGVAKVVWLPRVVNRLRRFQLLLIFLIWRSMFCMYC